MRTGLALVKSAPEKPKPLARRLAALKRLGVSEDQVLKAGNISSLLKNGKGGLTGALEAMRLSPDLSIISFLEKYDSIPSRDRESLPWEAIAIAARVDLVHLLGSVIMAIQAHSNNAVKIIALSHHPDITRKRVEFAQLPAGVQDRTAIDTALRFLPTVKGSTIVFNQNTPKPDPDEGGNAPPTIQPVDDGRGEDLDHLFPALAKTQANLIPARILEAGE